MKKAKIFFLVVAVAVTIGSHALGQPIATVDPSSGLPGGSGQPVNDSTTNNFNPATGLPMGASLSVSHPPTNIFNPAISLSPDNNVPLPLLVQAQELAKSGKYELALQCFLRLEADAQTTTNIVELETALSDWVQLGEKYPPALQALTDIHDQDMLEFEEGRGDLISFQRVVEINGVLKNDAATVELFKNLLQTRPAQTRDWFSYAEPALVRRGEYQLCLDCIGNPEHEFRTYCRTVRMAYETTAFVAERSAESRRQALATLQQPGRPPAPLYMLRDNHEFDVAFHAITNSFASEISNLVEILVHTDHQELADKIRGEAADVLAGLHPPADTSDTEEPAQPAGDWPPGYPWNIAADSGNVATNLSTVASHIPSIVASSNQFYGPTFQVTLNVNDNRVSDILNLDDGTVFSLRDQDPQPDYLPVQLPENGVAVHVPRQISPAASSPIEVISKRVRLFKRPEIASRPAWDDAAPPDWLHLPTGFNLDALNQLSDLTRASQGLPVLVGFQTSLGNAGLMEITGFTDHPRGVIPHPVLCRMAHDSSDLDLGEPLSYAA